MADYTSTARALALPIEEDETLSPQPRRSGTSPAWRRRSLSTSQYSSSRPLSAAQRWMRSADRTGRKLQRAFFRLTPLQQAGFVVLNIILFIGFVLFWIYNERIFAYLSPGAKKWRALPGGWLILWAMTFFVSFPPMIGYSSCVTIAGFVYGMPGWFIVASATVVGSTVSFIVSRTVLKSFVSRMTEKNKRFAALSLVLKHDGLKLLAMIRLCPLPYSLSNGATSTIPTVTWYNFALATALVSPKLLLHIFVGRQIGILAEDGNKMDAKTKAVSYISIVIGMVAGIATGYFIYVRTKARAQELEAEEAAAAGGEGGRRASVPEGEYLDESDDEEAAARRRQDNVSLHTAYADDEEDRGFRDDFTDDEDALERDPFGVGDGSVTGDEEEGGSKGLR